MRGVSILLIRGDERKVLEGLPALVRFLLEQSGASTDVSVLAKRIENVFGGLLWLLLGADLGRPLRLQDILALTNYWTAYVFVTERAGFPAALIRYEDLQDESVNARGCSAPTFGDDAKDEWLRLRTLAT